MNSEVASSLASFDFAQDEVGGNAQDEVDGNAQDEVAALLAIMLIGCVGYYKRGTKMDCRLHGNDKPGGVTIVWIPVFMKRRQ